MSMTVGIIGKPQSGKSTVFRALCGGSRIDSHGEVALCRVSVPDWRIDRLAELYQPEKVTNVNLDLAEFGASFTSKTGMKANIAAVIREADALAIVVGAFLSATKDAVAGDLRDSVEELLLLDQIQVENSIERMKKEKRNPIREQVLELCRTQLEAGKPLKELTWTDAQLQLLSGFRFLTMKPILAIINEPEQDCNRVAYPGLNEYCDNNGILVFRMCAPLEEDLAVMTPEEQAAFLSDLGFEQSARQRFLSAAYASLNLISFFTVGKEEVRAWPIRKATVAVKAAGKIHSDIERGFIRAELMRYEDLLALRQESKVKEAGKWRLVGKEYVIEDGDVVTYRFNV